MYVKIPMFGFTESYNISVSAALMMYTLMQRLHNSNIDWHLTEEEKDELRLDWSKKSIRRFWDFEQKFRDMHPEFYTDLPINFNIKMNLVEELSQCLTKMGKRIKVSYF